MLNVNKFIFIGVGATLLITSEGLSFLTQGCPKISLTPPKEPNRRFGSLTSSPSRSIFIYGERSTCEGKSIS